MEFKRKHRLFPAILIMSLAAVMWGNEKIELGYSEGGYFPEEVKAVSVWGSSHTLKISPEFRIFTHMVGAPKGRWMEFSDFKPDEQGAVRNRDRFSCGFRADAEGGLIDVETSFQVSGDSVIWKISVDNKSLVPVLKVTYPVLRGIRFSADGKNDELLWPVTLTLKSYHPIIKAPSCNLPSHTEKGEKATIDMEYPRSSMNFTDVSGDGKGIAVIGPEKLIFRAFSCAKSSVPGAVDLSITMLDSIMPGKKAEYEFILFPHSGDWRDAADYYRKVFIDRFGGPNYPEWVRYSNGFYAVCWQGGSTPYESESRSRINETWRLGMEQLQFWGQAGQHACPGYQLPDPMKGGEPGIKKMFKEIEATGLKTGGYFYSCGIGKIEVLSKSYRGVKWTEYPEELRPPTWEWLVKYSQYATPERKAPTREDGVEFSLSRSHINVKTLAEAEEKKLVPHILHDMMFHSDAYMDWLYFWVGRYVREYGTQTPYFDVYGLRPKSTEYNPNMERWGDGTEGIYRYNFLRKINDDFRSEIPDFIPMMEGTIDCYNTQAVGLISNFRYGVMPVYRYTFPSHILFEGMSNGHWADPVPAISNAYLDGNRFDVMASFSTSEIDRIVLLRDSLIRTIADASPLYEADMKLSSDKAQAVLFDASSTHGAYIVNFRNADKIKDIKVEIPERLRKFASAAFLVPLYGDFIRIHDLSNPLEIPPQAVSSLIIAGKDAPASSAVLPFILPEMRAGGLNYDIRLINMTSLAQTVKIVMSSENERFRHDVFEAELKPFEILRKDFCLKHGSSGDKSERLKLMVSWREAKSSLYADIFLPFTNRGNQLLFRRLYEPPFEDGGFEWDDVSRPLSDKEALGGRRSMAVSAGQMLFSYFHPAPNMKTKVSVYVKKTEEAVSTVGVYRHITKEFTPLKTIPGESLKGWTKLGAEFTTGDDTNLRLSFRNTGKSGVVYYDNLKVVQE